MHGDTQRIVALVLFGAGAILCACKVVHAGCACISAGLFVVTL